MVKLSNSPYEATVLTLEARKSFSLRIELHDRHGNVMSWDGLSATFTLGTLDPLEALLEIPATDGVFRIQASELNLKPRTYQFTITLRSRGYSFVIVKGDVKLVQNTEASSMNDLYGAAIPSETIAVQLDQMNVLKVSLRNTPLTLGTGGGGASTWSELVGKPLVFPPAQHMHDLQDVGGLVQALTALSASLDGKAPAGHHHPISDVSGLQAALEEKADAEHSHTWADITEKPAMLPADALAGMLLAGSDTQADQRRAGVTGPCIVYRTDLRALEAHPNTGAAGDQWVRLGGECHGEYSGSSTSIPRATVCGVGALTTDTAATSTPPPGTVSGETVTITRTGVYLVTATLGLAAGTEGRAFVEIRASGTNIGRAVLSGDDNATAAAARRLTAGTAVQMVGYHSNTGNVPIARTRLTITRMS